MGLELTTDKYPPITSQTRYPLRHAASNFDNFDNNDNSDDYFITFKTTTFASISFTTAAVATTTTKTMTMTTTTNNHHHNHMMMISYVYGNVNNSRIHN